MGNLEKKLENPKTIEDFPELKNPIETRASSEIEMTNKLAFLLSDYNMQRFQEFSKLKFDLDWSSYTFVCLHGTPPIKGEFDKLELPGQKIYFKTIQFSRELSSLTNAEQVSNVMKSTLKGEMQRLHELFMSVPKQKKIVLVYHSFGSFILGLYLHFFKEQFPADRLKGMIDIAGSPLRFYITARVLSPIIFSFTFQELFEHADQVHEYFLNSMKQLNFELDYRNKYDTMAFIHYLFCPQYKEIFETAKHYPKVLKLFIYGRKDTVFETTLLNQKAIYYAYKNKVDGELEEKLKPKFCQMYGKSARKVKNLQENFILNIEGGQHSLHAKENGIDEIKEAIRQYLALIHE